MENASEAGGEHLSLPPGVRILNGQSAIPLAPTQIQTVGYSLLWISIVALPVALFLMHATMRPVGFDMVILVAAAAVTILVSQLVLVVTARLHATAFSSRAISVRAAVVSFIYYGSWLLGALAAPDDMAGLDGRDRIPSRAEQVFGEFATTVIYPAMTYVGVALWVLTLVFIVVDGRRARREAIDAYSHAQPQDHAPVLEVPPPAAGVPRPPTPIEAAGYIAAWVAIIVLPLAALAIRVLADAFGIYTLVFIIPGLIAIIVGQVAMGVVAAAHSAGFHPKAMGARAVLFSLLYYACWLLLPLTASDGVPMPAESLPSPVEEQFGPDAALASFWVVAVTGVAMYVTTLVFIGLDGRRAARRAVAAGRPW